MINENELFVRSKFVYNKLLKYGFLYNNNEYIYCKNVLDNSFRIEIHIKNDIIHVKVFDLLINEEYYSYKIKGQNGEFVDNIRNIIKELLLDIKNNCCINNTFIYNQTNRIIDFIHNMYNDNPIFMFDKSPDCCVFKNLNNNKWYGIIMTIDKSKIDINSKGIVEIINLKIDSNKIIDLLNKDGFYKAYHMNKKYWISIILDDTLNDKVVEDLIIESYNNVLK